MAGYKRIETLTAEPWNIQPGETGKNIYLYKMFEAYRDDPAMTLEKVAVRFQSDYSKIAHISSAKRWDERRRAWQKHEADIAVKEREKAIADARKRHIKTALAEQGKYLQWLNKLNPETLKPNEAIKLGEKSTKLEMSALGADGGANTEMSAERIDLERAKLEIEKLRIELELKTLEFKMMNAAPQENGSNLIDALDNCAADVWQNSTEEE